MVTRAPEQAEELVRELERLGAKVFVLPTVSFGAPGDWQPLDAALQSIAGFDWILLTSQNAVRFLVQRWRELGHDVKTMQTPRPFVATVGPATSQAALDAGLLVNFTASRRTGLALAQELRGSIDGRTVLVPRSDRGDEEFPKALREMGAQVTDVVAYRTAAPDSLDPNLLIRVHRARVNAIVFASPSAYHNLGDAIGAERLADVSSKVDFAAIGPTTARAIRDAGARVAIEANEASAAGLADSIVKYYQRQDRGENRAMAGRQ
jgi:uroporphyrinogen III methyltransferase / synthase